MLRSIAFALVSLIALGCAPSEDDDAAERTSLEQELAPNDLVEAGTALRVTASSLNLRASGSTSSSVLQVLHESESVTCTETSGSNGWVHVKDSAGKIGWVSNKYVERASVGTGATCAPSRAEGAVAHYEKSLHDTIAYAEGTRGESKDGYDVIFGGRTVSSCAVHPNQCIAFGHTCSTAAGRYQFLTTTWSAVRAARGLTSFEPENQERGSSYLINDVRKATIPQTRPLTAAEFTNAMNKLSYEWASLPPGRYGQPNKSMSALRSTYCAIAGC